MNVSTEYSTIAPHGGELVDRRAPEEQREELLSRAEGFARVTLGPRALSDLEMISTGVFSPLTGFMVSDDYESVVETMHLEERPGLEPADHTPRERGRGERDKGRRGDLPH